MPLNFHLGHRKVERRTKGHTEGGGGGEKGTFRNIDMAHGSARGV